jgi:hypothetical protein
MLTVNSQIASIFLKFAEKFGGPILGMANRATGKIVEAISQNFSAYYETTVYRCSNIKTLISRDASIPIHSIYVKTYLFSDKKKIDDDKFITSLSSIRAAVILGGAGSGKSVFMRHLFLSLAHSELGILPLFVELRGFNLPNSLDLLPYVFQTVVSPGATITQAQLEKGIKSGAFFLILDGFDEVSPDIRPKLEAAILELQRNNPKIVIVVTSRPDERFYSWQNFKTFSVVPMKKKQVVQLIRKLPYDPSIRSKFSDAIEKELYEKHESFLSNPLLATMMLITYEQFAHIPDKVHIFYEQAFETLFFRHDTSKEAAFQRKRHVDLAINEFKNCLSSLSISTYVREKFQFSESEILESISNASEYERVNVRASAFLQDLLESVCIMQRDGTLVTFTHRSFQEYFSAFFISRNPSIDIGELLDTISSRSEDSVIGMAFDINRDLIERSWILPRIRTLNAELSLIGPKDLIGFASTAIGQFGLRRMNTDQRRRYSLSLEIDSNAPFVLGLTRLYPKIFENVFDPIHEQTDQDDELIAEKLDPKFQQKRAAADSGTTNDPNTYLFEPSDNEWIEETQIGEHFRRFRRALAVALAEIEKSVHFAETSGKNLVFKKQTER